MKTTRTIPDAATHWRLARGRVLALEPYCIVRILNVTPDSFSDGGELPDASSVVRAARQAIDEGAGMLDIGGESTRPGAERVSIEQQCDRVLPAIRALRDSGVELPISVDTTRAAVARRAIEVGADAINDVSGALEDEHMLHVARDQSCGLILMHRLAPPGEDVYSHDYESDPEYGEDVVSFIRAFLLQRMQVASDAGVKPESIVLDPGLGFGKSVAQNYALIANVDRIVDLGRPILAAASRKSFIGAATDETEPTRRVAGSVAASVLMALGGARLFRTHDVEAHRQALEVTFRAMAPQQSC